MKELSEEDCPYGNEPTCQPDYHGYYEGTEYEGYYHCDECWADETTDTGGNAE